VIRAVCPSDFEQLLTIEVRAFPKSSYDRGMFWSLYQQYPQTFLLAETDRIEGYIVFSQNGHVISMAVAPERRRRGIGTRLLREAIARCAGTPLWLQVRESNLGAQQFYQRLGFQEHRRIRRYYPDGEDAVIMLRSSET
jgi:ribosomal-protein-alanine N-acetyltransferase